MTLTCYAQTVEFNFARYGTDGDVNGCIEPSAFCLDLSGCSYYDILDLLEDIGGAIFSMLGDVLCSFGLACDQADRSQTIIDVSAHLHILCTTIELTTPKTDILKSPTLSLLYTALS